MKPERPQNTNPALYHFTAETENWYRQYDWNRFLERMANTYRDSPDFIEGLPDLLFSSEPIAILEEKINDFYSYANILLYNLFKTEFPGFAQLTCHSAIPLLYIEFIIRCSFPQETGEKIRKLVKDNGYTIIYFNNYSQSKKYTVLQAEKKNPFQQ